MLTVSSFCRLAPHRTRNDRDCDTQNEFPIYPHSFHKTRFWLVCTVGMFNYRGELAGEYRACMMCDSGGETSCMLPGRYFFRYILLNKYTHIYI